MSGVIVLSEELKWWSSRGVFEYVIEQALKYISPEIHLAEMMMVSTMGIYYFNLKDFDQAEIEIFINAMRSGYEDFLANPEILGPLGISLFSKLIKMIDSLYPITSTEDKWAISQIVWSPDNSQIAVGYYDGAVKFRDAKTGKLLFTHEFLSNEEYSYIDDLIWSPDGNYLLIALYNRPYIVWNINTQSALYIIPMFGENITFCAKAWSHDSSKIFLETDQIGYIKVFDMKKGEFTKTYNVRMVIDEIVFSSDHSLVAVLGTHFKIFSSANFELIKILDCAEGEIYLKLSPIVWSNNSKYIAGGSNVGKIRVWDVETGRLLLELNGTHNTNDASQAIVILELRFDSTSTYLTSIGRDGSIHTWTIPQGTLLEERVIQNLVSPAILSPNGSYLAYGGEDGILHIIPSSFPESH